MWKNIVKISPYKVKFRFQKVCLFLHFGDILNIFFSVKLTRAACVKIQNGLRTSFSVRGSIVSAWFHRKLSFYQVDFW